MGFLSLSPKINNQRFFDYYTLIKEEYISLNDKDFCDFTSLNIMADLKENTGYFWQVCPLVMNREFLENLPKNLNHTIEFIKGLEIMPVVAGFSVLLPYSEIGPHEDHDDAYITGELLQGQTDLPNTYQDDNTNGLVMTEEYKNRETRLIKYHFMIDTPSDCGLIVEGTEKILKDRDLYSFDEGKTHSVYNRSPSKRAALIMSFMKKEL